MPILLDALDFSLAHYTPPLYILLPPIAGLCLIASCAQIAGICYWRNAYTRCARQLTVLAAWLMCIAVPTIIIEAVHTYMLHKKVSFSYTVFTDETLAPIVLKWGMLFAAILFYLFLWKRANRPFQPLTVTEKKTLSGLQFMHISLGVLITSFLVFDIFIIMRATHGVRIKFALFYTQLLWDVVFQAPTQYQTTLKLLSFIGLSVCMGGAWGGAWLAIRRNTDDYGRDHYMHMMPWCAKWAVWPWLLFSTPVLIDAADTSGSFNSATFLLGVIPALLAACPILFWGLIIKSRNPLQHRITFFLALICALSLQLLLIEPWYYTTVSTPK